MKQTVILREARSADIPAMHDIRMRVKENILSNPLLVQEKDYAVFLGSPNKGWVASLDEIIIGFAIVDVQRANVWALFVAPEHESKGAGRMLNDALVNWYFGKHTTPLWLTTAAGTKAERFYTRNGWQLTGTVSSGELRFEKITGD